MPQRMVKREIKCDDKRRDLSRSPRYKQAKDELERLLTDIFSLTDFSTYPLTLKLVGCNESLNSATKTEVLVGSVNMAESGVPLTICLKGYAEKWVIMVHLNKAGQSNPEGFRNQILAASETVNEIESVSDSSDSLNDGQVLGGSSPSPVPLGSGEVGQPSSPHSPGGQAPIVIVVDERIAVLLRGWPDRFSEDVVAPQRQVRRLVEDVLGPEMLYADIARLLKKEGIALVSRERPSYPQVELTPKGIDLLKRLTAPSESTPVLSAQPKPDLEVVRALQEAVKQREEIRIRSEDIRQSINMKEEELAALKETLVGHEEAEAKATAAIEELLASLVGSDKA